MWLHMGQMSNFEQCSNQLQFDLILHMVKYLWIRSQLWMAELSGRQASCLSKQPITRHYQAQWFCYQQIRIRIRIRIRVRIGAVGIQQQSIGNQAPSACKILLSRADWGSNPVEAAGDSQPPPPLYDSVTIYDTGAQTCLSNNQHCVDLRCTDEESCTKLLILMQDYDKKSKSSQVICISFRWWWRVGVILQGRSFYIRRYAAAYHLRFYIFF